MACSIFHIDMNCFYAAVEMQRRPELRNQPVAVCGSQEERHGIVLTAKLGSGYKKPDAIPAEAESTQLGQKKAVRTSLFTPPLIWVRLWIFG